METLISGVIGGAVVFVAGKSDFLRNSLKGVIKMGYSVTDALTTGGGETLESIKDIIAESKSEYDAEQAAKAEAMVKA
ncbi:MAG: hypothetical protein L7F77_06775 [Candidatus Magnetominusculus sp. LBB02]|nr:hypothetical protein [Candidatus Magnetominusculus sp. LBB02]